MIYPEAVGRLVGSKVEFKNINPLLQASTQSLITF